FPASRNRRASMATRTIGHSDDHGFREAFADALLSGALPGETDGLDARGRGAAAAFIAGAARTRPPGQPGIAIESITRDDGLRRTRLAVINDDMPFLVDSV